MAEREVKSSRHELGPNGAFAASLPGYEVREGQLAMADAVERALREDRVLFCEAGTGTGKTLAYLVPALLSGKKVIVSTATRALEEQIMHKDVPLIERALGRRVSVALMKGLSNYLCLRRFNEARDQPESNAHKNPLRLKLLEQWYLESDSGDFAELAGIPEGDPLLGWVNSSSDTRVGPRCTYFDACYVTRMKRAAESAQLVVVNHHLFFADLALRGAHPGRVIPNYDAVIFDEAHQLEDVATLFFGVRVSERRISGLCNDAKRALLHADPTARTSVNLVSHVEAQRAKLFQSLRGLGLGNESRVRLERDAWSGQLYRDYLALDAALETLESGVTSVRLALNPADDEAIFEGLEGVARRARATRDSLAIVVDGARGRVAWLEPDARASAVSSSPVVVADLLRERIFERIPSVILTSATLTTPPAVVFPKLPSNDRDPTDEEYPSPDADEVAPSPIASPFEFERVRLGANNCDREIDELIVPSPFNFEANALLYLPRDLPDPKDPEFTARASERIAELVEASDGGAFVLTTSLRTLKLLQVALKPRLGDRSLLVQGQSPKQALLAAFRGSGRAVLLATMGFWEGVDVPGRALRLVILEKIPFAAPNDPLVAARAQLLEAAGANPFNDLFVPLAQMSLKQGFGRLIRTQSDRGVVALFDARVHRRGYGQRIVSALPPARRTADLEAACRFLREIHP
jgi:ATP-dependent DNA helicase DinG